MKTITLRLRNSRDKRIKKLDLTIDLKNHSAVDEWYRRFKYELETGSFLDKTKKFERDKSDKINRTKREISRQSYFFNSSRFD